MSTAKEVYLRYYKQQHGGQLPLFRGTRHDQDGAGLGDILRSIFRVAAPIARRAAPVLLKGATAYASNVIRARKQGVPLGDAMKQAIAPAIGDAADVAVKQFGGKRHRKRKATATAAVSTGGSHAKKRRAGGAKKRRVGGVKRRKAASAQAAGGKAKRQRKRKVGGGYKGRSKKQSGGKKRKATKAKLVF